MLYRSRSRRSGAAAVEGALIMSAMLMLTLGMIIGAMGVYRYNELAHLSHDCARFASVHGTTYASENSAAIAASTTGYPTVDLTYLQNYVKNRAVLCKSSKFTTISIQVVSSSGSADWSLTNNAITSNGDQNLVQVKLVYAWTPEAWFTQSVNLTHTAVLPMSY